MTITITKNEFNTLFINLNGDQIADSCVINRKRGFFNKLTQRYIDAKGFTPRSVEANPCVVLDLLAATGTQMLATVEVAF